MKENPWIHFDDVLRCRTINNLGVYPGVEHYPLLRVALRVIPHITVWEKDGHHRIFLNNV